MTFEMIVQKYTPTIKRIAYKLNGHFTYFDHDDLYQEAVWHLWNSFKSGKLADKTDSYILQGCYFYLRNYIRKAKDKCDSMSLNMTINEEEVAIEEVLKIAPSNNREELENNLTMDELKNNSLTKREKEILKFSLEGLTVREVGKKIGISHVMVVKILKNVKDKYRKLMN